MFKEENGTKQFNVMTVPNLFILITYLMQKVMK